MAGDSGVDKWEGKAGRWRQAVSHHHAPRTRQSILYQDLHIDEGLALGTAALFITLNPQSRMLEISSLCLSTLSHKMEKVYTTMVRNQQDGNLCEAQSSTQLVKGVM